MPDSRYRFPRCYTGSLLCAAVGPPSLIPRLAAPLLAATTAAVIGTGGVLLLTPPGHETSWGFAQRASYFCWFWVMALHFLVYIWRVPGLALRHIHRRRACQEPGRGFRLSLVVGTLLLGAFVGIVTIPLDATWNQCMATFHFFDH